jgi:hypothetical protein
MNEYDFGSRHRAQKRKVHWNSENKIRYLLSAEERLLQSISARASLPELLNKICNALDRDIGNVASLIAPSGDDATDLACLAAIAI